MTDIIILLIDITLFFLVYFLICFFYYIVIMEIHFFVGRTFWLKIFTVPFLVLFDAPLNIILMTALGLELPKEWLITARWRRWHRLPAFKGANRMSKLDWWRYHIAHYGCERHLDKYDSITGDHC